MFTPENLTVSKLRFYSIGIAAENKPLNTDILEVAPIEELNMLDGQITANTVDYKAKGVDALGKAYNTSVLNKISIKCKWLPLGSSNRITSPDVRRGEAIMVYQFSDADKFYWCTLQQDSHLRRLETVIFAFSGTSEEVNKLTPDNSYFIEISTHRKQITLHTSQANGEPFSYDIQINTKDGNIVITDDVGNEFVLDSKASRLFMKNIDNSSIDINKRNISFNSSDSINIQTNNYNVKASQTTIDGLVTTTKNVEIKGNLKTQNIQAKDIVANSVIP